MNCRNPKCPFIDINNIDRNRKISFAGFADEIVSYTLDNYLGMEIALYQLIEEQDPKNIWRMKTQTVNKMLAKLIVSDINDNYRTIILKNDEHINAHFDSIARYGHQLACVLNTMSIIYTEMLNETCRSKFNITNIDKYILSVKFQLNKNRSRYIDIIKYCTLEKHECTKDGKDILEMNPDDEFCRMIGE